MARAMISKSEAGGLVVALGLHAGLVALLVMRPAPRPLPEPERMQVSLSDDVGIEASSPSNAPAAPDLAPTLGESAGSEAVAARLEAPKPATKQAPKPAPAPAPVKVEAPKPEVARPAKAPAKPDAKADPVGAAIAAAGAVKPTQAVQTTAKPTKAPEGGSRIGADFLKGVTSSVSNGKAQTPPAKVAGPAVKAALQGAISRMLKPHWRVPQGVDTDQLVTIVSFDLNPDGSLAGPVTVVRQEGITDANRAQATLHRENAIRAVKLSAPFSLPPDYYDTWKHLVNVRFDRNLSQ
jgi:outer membrane biosynthesis protein TonB